MFELELEMGESGQRDSSGLCNVDLPLSHVYVFHSTLTLALTICTSLFGDMTYQILRT